MGNIRKGLPFKKTKFYELDVVRPNGRIVER